MSFAEKNFAFIVLQNLRPSMARLDGIQEIVERFTEKVTPQSDSNACWNWTAFIGDAGYGQFGFSGKVQGAHRVSYALFVGDLPHGMLVCHRCDNRECVNPKHLFIGTTGDNSADMAAKNRSTHGIKNPSAKLTEDDVRAIFNDQRTHRAIGRAYGIANPTVWSIKSGNTWSRVTGAKT